MILNDTSTVNPGRCWFGVQETPFKAVRVFNFFEDSGYGTNIESRVNSAVKACVKPLILSDGNASGLMPKFDPQVKVRVTVEVLGPNEDITAETTGHDWKSEARAWQTTAENLRLEIADLKPLADAWRALPGPDAGKVDDHDSNPKFTKSFLNTQNTAALDIICNDLGVSILDRGDTRQTRIDAILKAQG